MSAGARRVEVEMGAQGALDRLAVLARRDPARVEEMALALLDICGQGAAPHYPGLTPAEAVLVHLLVAARGDPKGMEQLVAALEVARRDRAGEVDSRLVYTLIHRIRGKIAAGVADIGGRIETVWARGYVFVARGSEQEAGR